MEEGEKLNAPRDLSNSGAVPEKVTPIIEEDAQFVDIDGVKLEKHRMAHLAGLRRK